MKIGSIEIEETDHGARIAVADRDLGTITRWVSLAVAAAAGVSMLMPFEREVIIFLAVVSVPAQVFVAATGLREGRRRGVARSTCPRIRGLVEVRGNDREYGVHPDDGPRRMCVVDGVARDGGDFLGAVVAASVDTTIGVEYPMPFVYVERSAAVLAFRSALYELDSFEGADQASAKELADRSASAIAGRTIVSRRLVWTPASPVTALVMANYSVLTSTLVGVGVGGPLLATGLLRPYAVLSLFLTAFGVASAQVIARRTARERSCAAERLLQDAKTAFGEGAAAMPFR